MQSYTTTPEVRTSREPIPAEKVSLSASQSNTTTEPRTSTAQPSTHEQSDYEITIEYLIKTKLRCQYSVVDVKAVCGLVKEFPEKETVRLVEARCEKLQAELCATLSKFDHLITKDHHTDDELADLKVCQELVTDAAETLSKRVGMLVEAARPQLKYGQAEELRQHANNTTKRMKLRLSVS